MIHLPIASQRDSVPARTYELGARLADEYNSKNAAHMAAQWKIVKEQEAKQKRINDEAFASKVTPTEEANYDETIFLKEYFLTENGLPDKTKPPHPMHLPGLSSRMSMHQAAERIPRLETASGGEGDEHVLAAPSFAKQARLLISKEGSGKMRRKRRY